MSNKLTLNLPWPPSVNNYKVIGRTVRTRNGKMLQHRKNSQLTLQFYCDVMNLVKYQKGCTWKSWAHSEEIELDLMVSLHPPHQKRYDIDNRLKVLFDSLIHANVIQDDSQISRLFVQKMDMIKEGQVIVEIREITL